MSFNEYRPLLFSIAYRMTGSAMEAEDIVQEGWLRYQAVSPDSIRQPKAYLAQVVTRLSLDHLKAARTQREQYIGPWLPEPILTEEGDPADTLSMAFMTLLERLNPIERAVFLLREVFDYDYAEIATIVEKNEATCRQYFRRAKQHLTQPPRFRPSYEAHATLLDAFTAVVKHGNLEQLEHLLAEDVEMHSDGGGKSMALRKPLYGMERVSAFFRGLLRQVTSEMRFETHTINALSAVVIWWKGVLFSVMIFEVVEGKIVTVRSVLNPDKLAYLQHQLLA
jgi:RNA polymerase sigma-70 factor (ECF subfamily)